MRSLVCSAAFAALIGCGERPPVVTPDAGEELGIASSEQIVAWEGQTRFVTVLSSASGEPLDGATVSVEDPAGPLELIDQRCAGTRCAVVLRVRDQSANTGAAIPPPIDGRDAFLRVVLPDAPDLRTLLRVMPLDTIGGGGTEPLRTSGVRLASSADMAGGTAYAGEAGGEPIRWVVFGDARFAGSLDVSATGEAAFGGGHAGGAAAAAGGGPSGGGAGEGGAGGGGGGGAEPGEPGDGAADEPGAGGAGGVAGDPACVLDFFETACGGGGGGGAAGAGGAGGGALVIVSLGELDLSAATLRASGGDGATGGGGGGGGFVALAAPRWRPPMAVELGGGAGEGRGGAGGPGVLHVQAPGDAASGAVLGPAVDLASVPAITMESSITIGGAAAPGARVILEDREDGSSFEGTADASGAFSISVELAPGLNRFEVAAELDGARVRSWVGTSIDLDSPTPGVALPVGALIDVARVP